MFESHVPAIVVPGCATFAPASSAPERRSGDGRPQAWMTDMLDEIDYGMVLVGPDARVVYMNHAARIDLDGQHPLRPTGTTLRTQDPQDMAALCDALAGAQRGRRKLLMIGSGAQRVSISVVPQGSSEIEGPLTLLVLGKRQVCERLSVQAYARSCGLTMAETRVLESVCDGVPPAGIARQTGVALSTVRTQIGSIRAKTGAASIRELMRQVAVLPPLVGALRAAAVLR